MGRIVIVTRFAVVLTALAMAGCGRDRARTLDPEPLAIDQSCASSDLAVLGRVRRGLVADPGLSIAAKNAVVVVRSGVVTLRGSLDVSEHARVVSTASSVPGVVLVDDRIESRKE